MFEMRCQNITLWWMHNQVTEESSCKCIFYRIIFRWIANIPELFFIHPITIVFSTSTYELIFVTVDDGSGTISCFHKFKYNREDLLKNLCDLPTSAQFLQTSVCPNLTRTSDETVFNVTKDNTVVRNLENDTSDAFRAVNKFNFGFSPNLEAISICNMYYVIRLCRGSEKKLLKNQNRET